MITIEPLKTRNLQCEMQLYKCLSFEFKFNS